MHAGLAHVHQCTVCGGLCSPEQFSARDNIRGLYECPFCHTAEALNVVIVSLEEFEQQS